MLPSQRKHLHLACLLNFVLLLHLLVALLKELWWSLQVGGIMFIVKVTFSLIPHICYIKSIRIVRLVCQSRISFGKGMLLF